MLGPVMLWDNKLHFSCSMTSGWTPHCRQICHILYPCSTEGGMGVYWNHPMSVCPSVRPSLCLSVDKVSGTFWKNYWLNSFHTWCLPLWCEFLDPYTFSCSWPHFWLSGGQIFGRKWGFWNFLKKLLAQFISYLAFTLIGWVSWPIYIFMFLASFSALWWPNIWPKMGFPEIFEKKHWPNSFHTWHLPLWGESLDPYIFSCSLPYFRPSGGQIFGRKWGFMELFEKTIGSIHFIPGIYPYGVSLFTRIHFGVPSLIFGPLVAKYLAESGVSGTFRKNCWLSSFHT